MDEDLPVRAAAPPGLPRPLTGLSIEDLQAYRAALELEIGRVAAEIERRRAVRSAAEALFRHSPG